MQLKAIVKCQRLYIRSYCHKNYLKFDAVATYIYKGAFNLVYIANCVIGLHLFGHDHESQHA